MSLSHILHCQGKDEEQREPDNLRLSALATEHVGARVSLHRAPYPPFEWRYSITLTRVGYWSVFQLAKTRKKFISPALITTQHGFLSASVQAEGPTTNVAYQTMNRSTSYYTVNGQRAEQEVPVALRKAGFVGDNGLKWMLGDHLGSTSVVVNASGANPATQGYVPWGETRYGSVPTGYQYTGQLNETTIGLYWYGARWYDSSLGRWVQPDSIVPVASQGVQAWDRYTYVNNNPVRYNDPSGHDVGCAGKDDYYTCGGQKSDPYVTERSVGTSEILLNGGPGTNPPTEENFTEFSTSGASTSTKPTNPAYWGDVADLGGQGFVWLRDNMNVRSTFSDSEIYGRVYYEVTPRGLVIRGAQITNNSKEIVGISSIDINNKTSNTGSPISKEILYPYKDPNIVAPNHGVADPGTSSDVVGLNSKPMYLFIAVNINISTPSGRWGLLTTNITYDPYK